jgi:hypothetical protein
MRPCAEPSHASVGAPCTTRRLDCPDAMPSAIRGGRVLRGLLMQSRPSYTAVRSAPFSLHSRPLSAASEPASLPPTVVTVPRCVTIVESAGLGRTADGSLILRWREQPLTTLTDGMSKAHTTRSATCDNHGKLWHEQAHGLRGSAADWPRGNSTVRRGFQMCADCHASVRLTTWLAICSGAIATMHADQHSPDRWPQHAGAREAAAPPRIRTR